MTIDVAVIPCAGAGTRLMPATRVVPKPLIPVVDRPMVQYVVEEAVASGVTEVILIVDEGFGTMILDHFTAGSTIDGLEGISFTAVVQENPKGLGDAVSRAQDAVALRPFLCLLSDSFFAKPEEAYTPQLVDDYDGRAVLAVTQISEGLLDRYGVVAVGDAIDHELQLVTGAIEKPGVDRAPSSLGIVGRYVFSPEIFDALARVEPGLGGEIQLTDAIDRIASQSGAAARVVEPSLLDAGTPAGLAAATAAVALERPNLADAHRSFLEDLLRG
jgi:UTP--glucose-1-phosphate uridylyltransferase